MTIPMRDNPMFTFIMLKISGTEAGRTTLHKASFFVPPSVRISFSLSWSVSQKPVYRFKIAPKIATEIHARIMVFMLLPSHTINKGARADFGRLLRTTR